MKTKFSLLFCIFCVLQVYAQQDLHEANSFSLNSSVTGDDDYLYSARDNIILKPGFNCSGSNVIRFTAAINPNIVLKSSSSDQYGGASYGVAGSIEGEASVLPTGGASYAVPIKLPPSTGGMAPELSIVYNSQGSDGLMGIGFSISGLSVISRGPKSLYNDWIVRAVQLTTDDPYMLDGQRLILVAGSYGADGSEYRTENNSFQKVVMYGNQNGGPVKFKVWTKSGLIQEYGSTADSQIEAQGSSSVIYWLLNKVSDSNGNFYTITYTEDNKNGEYCPARIDYTANNSLNLNTNNTIVFNYSDRDMSNPVFIKGSISSTSKILNGIDIYTGNAHVKGYTCNYSHNYGQNTYLLSSLRECGSDWSCYNPTLFDWYSNTDYTHTEQIYDRSYYANAYVNHANITTGDFNGDGQMDFITIPKSGAPFSGWRLFLTNPQGNQCVYSGTGALSSEVQKLYAGDFNGDGKTDFIAYAVHRYKDTYNDITYYNSFVYYATENSGSITFTGGACILSDTRPYDIQVGDVNGDGLADAIVTYPRYNDCKIIRSEMSGTTLLPLNYTAVRYLSGSMKFDRVQLGDFNGDGLSDIMNLDANGYQILESDGYGTMSVTRSDIWPTKNHYLNFGDFNGDGKTDMLLTGYYNPSNKTNYSWDPWQVHLSTGTGFKEYDTDKKIDPQVKQIFVGDINGDGKDDFFAVDKFTENNGYGVMARIPVYITTGFGPQYNYVWDEYGEQVMDDNGNPVKVFAGNKANFSYYPGDMAYSLKFWNFFTGDFNGDGKMDYFYTSAQDTWNGYQLYTAPTNRSNLLKKVTDGLGNATCFTYKPITNDVVYSKSGGGTYPTLNLEGAFQVVDSLIQPNGIGGSKVVKYHYEDARYHKRGRGFLGFAKVRTVDTQTGIYSTTINEYEPTTMAVATKRTETRRANGDLLAEADYTNSLKTYQSGVFTFMPASVVEKKYELGNTSPYSTTSTAYTYDDYGNVLTTVQSKGTESTVTTTNVYTNDASKWYLGRLTQTTVVKQSSGQPDITTVSQFEYDPSTGLLSKETLLPGNVIGHVKKYDRDGFGNITKTTTTAGGVDVYTRSVFDSRGQSASYVYNALEQPVIKTYHPLFGAVTSETDPNGLTSTIEYDGFGKVVKTRSALGPQAVKSYLWCKTSGGSTPARAVYYTYTESSANPPVTEYFDGLGRPLRKVVKGFDGTDIFTDTEYNERGEVSRSSDPYFSGGTAQWTVFTYDELGRVVAKTLPDNSQITIAYSGLTTTTTNPLGQSDTRSVNLRGLPAMSMDAKGQVVTYVYDSSGNLTETHDPAGNVVKMEYDLLGHRTKLTDPDLGVVSSEYNGFGELVKETDSNGNTQLLEYDALGRMTKRTEKEGITQWTYDTATHGIGLLASVSAPKGISQSFEYDELSRLKTQKETIDGATYATATTYDAYSRADKISYPSSASNPAGMTVQNVYNSNGYLAKVQNPSTGKVYWTAQTVNARGQLEQALLGNGRSTIRQFNAATGLVQRIYTPGIRDWSYSFNAIGSLTGRTDNLRNLTEAFEYDNLNRLTRVTKNGAQTLGMTYDGLGNILTKSDVGHYIYGDGNGKLTHAVTAIETYAGTLLKLDAQHVTYTSFDKVESVSQNTDSLWFVYGVGHDRERVDTYKDKQLKKSRYYINALYELEKDYATGEEKSIYYITAGGASIAIYTVSSTGAASTAYLHKDELGSVQYITGEDGSLQQELSYDAWGNRRDPATWTVYTTVPAGLMTARGFTGHEHLDLFDLVNMNGRMYDPVIGRFLSPDPVVQDLANLQCFNRYSYCVNNLLSLTDPSGYSWLSRNWKSLVGAVVGIAASIATVGVLAPGGLAALVATWPLTAAGVCAAAGAVGGFVGGVTGTLLNGGNAWDAMKAGVIGGLVGGASGFLSFAAGSVTSTGLTAVVERMGRHAFCEAWLAGMQGQNMWKAAIVGSMSSLGGEGIQGLKKAGASLEVRTFANAIIGGTVSMVGGGNFANGAVTGAFIMLYNHDPHDNSHLREHAGDVAGATEQALTKVKNTDGSIRYPKALSIVKGAGIALSVYSQYSDTQNFYQGYMDPQEYFHNTILNGISVCGAPGFVLSLTMRVTEPIMVKTINTLATDYQYRVTTSIFKSWGW